MVGEQAYAEFLGDSENLLLSPEDNQLLLNANSSRGATAVILISGRPLVITSQLPSWQALVAAWLPGSQGDGIADVLFGKANFSGKLSQSWPSSMNQLPFVNRDEALFPYGYGLKYPTDSTAAQQSSNGAL